jgi:hypothetical protein
MLSTYIYLLTGNYTAFKKNTAISSQPSVQRTPYFKEGQTAQWSKEKEQKDKQ